MEKENIRKIAEQTLHEEALAIQGLKQHIDDEFVHAIEVILEASGRVIITGIGKSSDIGRKFTATLNSTGTPAFFLHAADAIHGDLGMVRPDDIVVCLSKSGDTPEIKVLLPLIKANGNTLIGIVGNPQSYLGLQSDIVLNVHVEHEACPNNLVPTASTAAQLAMCDALAVALLTARGFTIEDFARLHPGGALGKKLYLRVSDLYLRNEKPQVETHTPITQVIFEISSKRLGCTAVLDQDRLIGIITDGDLRRMLQKNIELKNIVASDVMTTSPKTILPSSLVADALDVMRSNNITQLLVTENGIYLGVIHLHDILKEGVV
ncbi:MAG TPA: KpsF/GutQ family sugar-phosphate isomerase [Bacteroidales bacterium]|nr:KpsF/GutQ family sugar-phosphate isomerase [Bacteroidales bacterium]MDI9574508.1 KpsF/GutQ family sugar-phosphate isomerase [Bacteroidota bacterium]OQC61210.1 MAG: Arabinose 5-phosphate isomerase KdsD [Bacteroidetes bacterium ADurb.Bin012]MBP9511710.1 KpsF/GutQ family sugar-phosphate isomerase [Bacteroidales bacterium]NMD16109.1 KpsF/GutQ family sugar-phosphate isomerase [Bacteroidales bacterium]